MKSPGASARRGFVSRNARQMTTLDTAPRFATVPRSRAWGLACLGLVLLGFVACDAPREEAKTVDLLELLPVARVHYEIAEMTFGAPEDGRFVRSGWGVPGSRGDDGTSFRWITEDTATLDIWLSRPRDLVLVWTAWPLVYPGASEQTIRVEAGGRDLGTLVLEPSWAAREVRLAWPAEAQRAGVNVLRLEPSSRQVPADVIKGATDQRALAAAFASLRLEGDIEGGAPRIRERATQPTLVMPAGSRVEVFLRPEQPMSFVLDDLRGRSSEDAEATLVVSVLSDAGDEARHELSETDRPTVPVPAGVPVRVALEAPASGVALQLVAPRLLLEGRAPEPATDSPVVEEVPGSGESGEGEPWNVLIYLVDSLRADHLGCYGYERPTSPELDRFAAEDAVRFDRVVAQASWTRAAVASLLTGLYPHAHGAVGREDRLVAETPYLSEILNEAGWATAGFVTNGNVSAPFGFDRGWDTFRHFSESNDVPEHHVLSDALNEHVFDWLDAHDPARPFFLYVHTSDPHYPYRPPEPWLDRFASEVEDPSIGDLDAVVRLIRGKLPVEDRVRQDLIDLYDGEIAFNDHHFGRLLDRLRADGLYDRTLIVFLGDHGEEFLDHDGWGHGATLYEEQLRVPLVIKLPNGERGGVVVDEPVRQIDVLATLLDVLGRPIPSEVQGTSRLAAMRGVAPVGRATPSFAELHLDGEDADVIVDGRFKLILDGAGDHAELYDVIADPGERHDLADERPVLAGYLRAQLLSRRATSRTVGRQAADIDPELRSRLEALGYLN